MSVMVRRFRIKINNNNGEVANILDLVNCLDDYNLIRVAERYYYGPLSGLVNSMLDYKVSKILRQLPGGLQSHIYDVARDRYYSEERHTYDPRHVSYYIAKFIVENCADAELLKRT